MRTTRRPAVRAALALPLAAALLFGTAACADEGAGIGEDEFGQLEQDYAELEERVGVLEDEVGV